MEGKCSSAVSPLASLLRGPVGSQGVPAGVGHWDKAMGCGKEIWM